MTSIPIPGIVEGKSLVPVFKKPKTDIRDDLFYAYRNIQRGIRTNDNWKLIVYNVKNRDTTQLFNLNKDPWELNNIANNSKYQEKVNELTERLKRYMKRIDDPMDLDKENWGKEKVVLPAHKIDHKAVWKPVKYLTIYSSKYTGGGNGALTDGKQGMLSVHDEAWIFVDEIIIK